MKAQDARQQAYSFYENEIISILNKIVTEAGLGGMRIEVDNLPVAIEMYLIEHDFHIARLADHIIYISWDE